MTTADLLAELRELDVRVELDGERLRLNAPAGVLTDELKRRLVAEKPAVIAFLLEAQRLATQQRAIVPLQPDGSATPIFAVAGHNGDVFAYRALAGHLGADQPFFGLQPPGLEEGTAPLTWVEDVADYLAAQIRTVRPAGPVTIAGYCAGGSVAFELARRLSESGVAVPNLILFGAPFCTFYRRPQWALAWLRHYGGRAVLHARTLLTMAPAERRRYLADRAAHIAECVREFRNRDHDEADDPVLVRRAAVVSATLAAARRYTPTPADLHIDIMLPNRSWQRSPADPLRWRRFVTSATVFAGPDDGNSDTMLLADNVGPFATFVAQACRARAGAVLNSNEEDLR